MRLGPGRLCVCVAVGLFANVLLCLPVGKQQDASSDQAYMAVLLLVGQYFNQMHKHPCCKMDTHLQWVASPHHTLLHGFGGATCSAGEGL